MHKFSDEVFVSIQLKSSFNQGLKIDCNKYKYFLLLKTLNDDEIILFFILFEIEFINTFFNAVMKIS